MKEEFEKLYESYFPMIHQKCSDECSKKYLENTMRQDFVKEITHIISMKKEKICLPHNSPNCEQCFSGSVEIVCLRCNDNGCPVCDGTKGSKYNPEPY